MLSTCFPIAVLSALFITQTLLPVTSVSYLCVGGQEHGDVLSLCSSDIHPVKVHGTYHL
ncbi:uncharacterized protein LACBIDRAFT_310274 [Laccaria bicolor S238N-H82]|uniref:Predicted protein n=1 Tax=Laccaria bicolor (strain S238N-H82 / ATCC MYA-4686) TaxID=486041 RepID=B0DTV0_LACBS|nr:uncharacterized protein LACBIDRAFT_310271 [Laccaria bicolor S238N-H82]XP_001887368.1 uncharacterized protein LACBIDRAFT_310275 [Laccaria bicolor S238N-H82]XP_001887435.1 uncharacterized protein LACBIDRAFT_310274 [Laccaria bicolor S238N-H82]EDR01975.1 predicted protein [Laccaria bicolor S238N-H82]EDR01977.1 predicted protein [Laccaria bicolor S238N-H82]EDR02044.1 predicted protein [Laccaria bicolor S238N-H82]|eukprot:XP_001887366.1 predicted protein [Laccaria bicolor S238N-H82]